MSSAEFIQGVEVASAVSAAAIGYIGMAVMCFGAMRGFVYFIVCTKRQLDRITEIRVDVAKHLSLGLEFLVAKDIIETLIHPTLQQLLLLGCLITIRTAIAYIISWELKQAVIEIAEEQQFEEAARSFEEAQRNHHKNHRR